MARHEDLTVGDLRAGYEVDSRTVGTGVLAIPTDCRYVAKSTGGVEALTLGRGSVGQRVTVALIAAGGAGTLTPDTCSGFATVALIAAGDNVTLEWVNEATGWVIVGAAGVLAPPVISV